MSFSKKEVINLQRLLNSSLENHLVGVEILIQNQFIPNELYEVFRSAEEGKGRIKIISIEDNNTPKFYLDIGLSLIHI